MAATVALLALLPALLAPTMLMRFSISCVTERHGTLVDAFACAFFSAAAIVAFYVVLGLFFPHGGLWFGLLLTTVACLAFLLLPKAFFDVSISEAVAAGSIHLLIYVAIGVLAVIIHSKI